MNVSVLDLFSIGIGPSSSHTVGPMRAAAAFAAQLATHPARARITAVQCDLYGSLGATGHGHGTGKAVILGLLGQLPESVDPDRIEALLQDVAAHERIAVAGGAPIAFPRRGAILFHKRTRLPEHANALRLQARCGETVIHEETWFSIGGGFVVTRAALLKPAVDAVEPPLPFQSAAGLLAHCAAQRMSIAEVIGRNEESRHGPRRVNDHLSAVWRTMWQCIQRGLSHPGTLPGGQVQRRAPQLAAQLQREDASLDPLRAMDWVNAFALAVSEENAAGGRVVTAPTNGAAGIIPAVLAYINQFVRPVDDALAIRFLLTAGAIGSLYKTNASISGAEVGCQGEVGVACSMAAAGLAAILGGTPEQVENAAEIGMEHNLGLTCDPVGGLVQVPCIERNAMGAIKAINAARLALRGDGQHKVSLDKVIKTMRDTGRDMSVKYKETARGGLAVNVVEC